MAWPSTRLEASSFGAGIQRFPSTTPSFIFSTPSVSAEGHFFSFSEGDAYTSGATSFAWPFLLAPLYLLGLRDLSIIWGAWALAFLALGALAVETYRLALPLAGRGASLGAGAMVLCFGGYLWCAASGMEVVPTAWALAFGLRHCIEWGETPDQRTTRGRGVLLAARTLGPPRQAGGAPDSGAGRGGARPLSAPQPRGERPPQRRRAARRSIAGPLGAHRTAHRAGLQSSAHRPRHFIHHRGQVATRQSLLRSRSRAHRLDSRERTPSLRGAPRWT